MTEPGNQVVVLIIAYREQLTDLERISLFQCLKVLKDYPVRIVKPRSLNLSGWPVDHASMLFEDFPDQSFEHVGAYSRLLLSPDFYKRFIQFEYVLIYQLDAFVFRDELKEWCCKGYDYMGAPWFQDFSNDDEKASLTGVGNGGFSLRNVQAHLRVLRSFAYISPPGENWRKRMKDKTAGESWFRQVSGFLLDMSVRNNTFWLLNSYMGFEDQFWCLVAAKRFRWFRLPAIEEAMTFSFEMQPRRMYNMNGRQLPFGCHAWWKYDLEFWQPHIEQFGYRLPAPDAKPRKAAPYGFGDHS